MFTSTRAAPAMATMLIGVCVLGFAPRTALAYRTFADDPAVGYPARWQSPVLWEVVARPPAGQPDTAALLEAARQAVGEWSGTECVGVSVGEGTRTRSALRAEDGRTGIGYVEDWAAAGFPEGQGAVTDVRLVRSSSGEASIIEADIYLNAEEFDFVLSEPGSGELDLQAVLTHEFGHVLGLLHPCETTTTADGAPLCGTEHRESSLHPEYAGLADRTLGADDEAGVCFLYDEARACGMTCPAGYACSAGTCVDPSCGLPACPDSCDDTLCAGPECPEVEECADDQACLVMGTNRGQCADPGVTGTRCRRGEDCASNLCLTTMGLGLYCTETCAADAQCPGEQRCLAVEGRQVCAPLPSDEGCSITPTKPGWTPPLASLLMLATGLLWGARRSKRS